MNRLGIGIGWRPQIDLFIEQLPDLGFVEVVAENIDPRRLPVSLRLLRDRGVPVIPHGISLSLGGAERPDRARLAHLAACAEAFDAPLVSEHVAFVRSGKREAGHLLPVPRTADSLAVMVENVLAAQAALPVPLALENVAALLAWPDDELSEADFITDLLDKTGAWLLLDVANLYTNQINFGAGAIEAMTRLPLTRIAYVHVAGGKLRDGLWHDTHRHDVPAVILDVLAELVSRCRPPGVMLERDGRFPPDAVLASELEKIRTVVTVGG
jgi:uncharacterized protein (UPF0276 family)